MTPIACHTPDFPLELVVGFGGGFLVLLTLVAVALLTVLRGREGSQAPRVLTGCAVAGGLGCLGFIGVVVFGICMAIFTSVAVVEDGPIKSVEVIRTDDTGHENQVAELFAKQSDEPYAAHVIVKFEGWVDPLRVKSWLERETAGDVGLVDALAVTEEGEDLTVLDFGVRVSSHDLEDLHELEEHLPFDLPKGLRIEIR